MDEQIDKLVDKLGISIEEAKQLIADDKAIDQGADLFPQTAEQKKVSKKMTITGTRKTTVYDFKNKQRKPDEEKEDIVAKIAEFVAETFGDSEITNKSRQIAFNIGENRYELTLTRKRK